MEGAVFYYTCFFIILWLLINCRFKNKLLYILTGLVVFGDIQLKVGNFIFQLAYIILAVTSFYYVSLQTFKHQLTILICSLIVGMTYSSLFIIQIYDPVSFLFNPFIMIALIILLMILLLCKKSETRVLVLIIGFAQGEILNYLIFTSINLKYAFGTVTWLDSLSFIFLLMVCLEWIRRNISLFLSKKQNRKAEI